MSKKQFVVSFRGFKMVERLSSLLIRVVRDHCVDGDDYLFAVMTLANLSIDLKKYAEENENEKEG